eukprot:m.489775 g.489775  ORF g.489775 m.489775 type:complete len:239 (+) comp27076_c0_seq1:254-970(+)
MARKSTKRKSAEKRSAAAAQVEQDHQDEQGEQEGAEAVEAQQGTDGDSGATSDIAADTTDGVDVEPEPRAPTPPTLPSRSFLPATSQSHAGLYLEQNVWPVLLPALEKLFVALRKRVPLETRQAYADPSMRRIVCPEDAQGFDPVDWLATYLKRYNPNVPAKYNEQDAAIKIQATARGHRDRQLVRAKRTQLAHERAVRLESERRHAAATAIQAAFRGHCLRVSLALGKSDLVLGRGR